MWILAQEKITPGGGYARRQIIACPKCTLAFYLWTPSARDVQTPEDIQSLQVRIAETCHETGGLGHPHVLNIHDRPPRP
jgi:hypothetical protein